MDKWAAWHQGWPVTKEGPGRGWWGPPKGTHIGAGQPEFDLRSLVPQKNLSDLKLDDKQGGGLVGAKDSRGRDVNTFMYNPRTGTLLAGSRQKYHSELHNAYAAKGEKYDDFVKMNLSSENRLRIYMSEHAAKDEVDAWNKAFAAARAMRVAGFPSHIEVELHDLDTGEKRTTFPLG